ncbi:MAG: DUF2935 domain-containing protein [Oscillospiraceae bacterium]|nr:DUF2935 domain-containing protein [Oscillospiraceae bacterium]
MQTDNYVRKSLELHLFFGRIMKEHSLFLQASFTPVDAEYADKAAFYRKGFEDLLRQTVSMSDGLVSGEVLCSGEIVTEFTLDAEDRTECLTGLPVDQHITQKTKCLTPGERSIPRCNEKRTMVRQLNRTALRLLEGLIGLKEEILECVQHGSMFTTNYPLLIEHILREAKLYQRYITTLEKTGNLSDCSMLETERFWNQIMMEHALFIRGLLDPCEKELIHTADDSAKGFCELMEHSRNAHSKANALEQTTALRDFKAAGTQGILECKIRSVILPLLADHVLREANHYIRLLKD